MRITGHFPRLFSISLVFLVVAATSAAAQDTLYRLIELRADGGDSSKAYALNNTGQIVGWMEADSGRHSAHWHVETATDLHGTVHFALAHPYDLFDLNYSEAYDISNADQIVGTARTEIDCPPQVAITNAFLLRPAVLTDLSTPYPGDALTNLHTLGDPCVGAWDSASTGISNSNHVVGWADRDDGSTHAVITVPSAGQFYADANADLVNDLIVDLGTFRGDTDPVSAATAVNDNGRVTGYSYTLQGSRAAYHAFLITPNDTNGDGIGDQWYVDANGDSGNDLMQDLDTLGGYNSWGRDINSSSQVVGESDTDPSVSGGYNLTRAFLWQNGTMTDLGALADDSFSAASAINNNGVIVGWAGNDDNQRRAFIYENGQMRNLNDLICTQTEEGVTLVPGITLTEARDINEDGWIVGWGNARGSSDDGTRGFLLIPIDASECVVEEDSSDDNGSGSSGNGSNVDGDAIVGTPGNLGDGSDSDDASGAGGTSAAAGLCGFGMVGMLPLMLAGFCWMKISLGRRLRRIR